MRNILLFILLFVQTLGLASQDYGEHKSEVKKALTQQKSEKEGLAINYLGTPVQAYDSAGDKVWECALDIYGKVMTVEGEASFVPFRYQGQYEDQETGLYYNRFRYYSPDTGTYLSKDPIGLSGGMPNLYSYVRDTNIYLDIFGLDFFYQLLNESGDVVYNGITKNPIEGRIGDHLRDTTKDFVDFKYIEVDDRIASRNLEGSALHNANGQGLQNATRNDGKYYPSYAPENLADGRTYHAQAEIDAKMQNAKTGTVRDGKVKLNCG